MRPVLEAILFDLGDTLIDFGPQKLNRLFNQGAHRAYEWLKTRGKDVPPYWNYFLRQWGGIRYRYILSRITRKEFDALDLLRAQCRRMEHPLSEEELAELAWRFYLPLRERTTTEPGLGEQLKRYRERGLKLAVVSNTFVPGEVLDRHLAEEGLLEHLPVRVYSCDFGRRKPNPLIFREGLRRLGAAPAACLFVGDTPRKDMRGAKRLGMTTVLKTARPERRRRRADFVIRTMAELDAVVESLR